MATYDYIYNDGIQFGNVAAVSPTLNYYGASTFVPVLAFGGASVGITYATQVGSYVRIGNLVWIRVQIVLTSKGSSTGAATVSGLPFAPAATGWAILSPNSNVTVPAGNLPYLNWLAASTTANLTYGAYSAGSTPLLDSAFSNTSSVVVVASYGM